MPVISKKESEKEVGEALTFTQYALTIEPDFYGLAHLKGLIVLLLLYQSDPLGGNSPTYIAKSEK